MRSLRRPQWPFRNVSATFCQEQYVLDQQKRAQTVQETNKRVSEALNHLETMRVSLRNQGSENSWMPFLHGRFAGFCRRSLAGCHAKDMQTRQSLWNLKNLNSWCRCIHYVSLCRFPSSSLPIETPASTGQKEYYNFFSFKYRLCCRVWDLEINPGWDHLFLTFLLNPVVSRMRAQFNPIAVWCNFETEFVQCQMQFSFWCPANPSGIFRRTN